MSRSWLEYLRHILDEAEYLMVHSQRLSRERFIRDETLEAPTAGVYLYLFSICGLLAVGRRRSAV
jgi:uncharacterized protein with HEPN domain